MPADLSGYEPRGKVILNAGEEVQNVVNYKDMYEITTKTLKILVKQLLDISGPFSRNMFILKSNDVLAGGSQAVGSSSSGYQVFTRDGIKTLEKIEFASPLQRYIKDEILRWMGSRIDDACKDGTTSAMIYTASFVLDLMRVRDNLTFVSLSELERVYDDCVKLIHQALTPLKVTPETIKEYLDTYFKPAQKEFTLKECTYILARMMADTASSGNREVAEAVATVVNNTPQLDDDCNIIIETPFHETVESGVKAEQAKFNYQIPVTVLTPDLLNHERNTEFKVDRAHLLVLPEGLMRDSMTGVGLETFINGLPASPAEQNNFWPEYFIILIPSCTNQHDSIYLEQVLSIGKEKGFKFFIAAYERTFGYKSSSSEWVVIDGLYAKAEVPLLNERVIGHLDIPTVEPFLIKEVSVYCDHHQLYLDDIIPVKASHITNEEADACIADNIHFGERYPEYYPNYVQTRDWIKDHVKKMIATADASWAVNIADCKRTLINMTVQKPWKIVISGKHHDRAAYQAIVEDAAGSTTVALKHGVYFNGPIKLLQSVLGILSNDELHKEQAIMHSLMLNAFLVAAVDMAYSMFGKHCLSLIRSIDPIIDQCSKEFGYFNAYQDSFFSQGMGTQAFGYLYTTPDTPKRNLNLGIASAQYFEKNKDAEPMFISYVRSILMPDTLKEGVPILTPPCQVGNLFDVLFTRLKEVALKYCFTDNLIAPDTLYDNGTLNRK